MSHVCVHITFLPSDGRLIVIGSNVGRIFSMGVPSMTKIDVAPMCETFQSACAHIVDVWMYFVEIYCY